MKKVVSILLTLALALGICVIPVNNNQVSAATKKRTITKTKICGVGDYVQLIKSTNGKVKWKSSNSKVASIDSTTKSYCLVKAKKAGTATISVTYKNVTYKWKITVKKVQNVKNESIYAIVQYFYKADNTAIWGYAAERKANYTGKMLNGNPYKYGSFTTTNTPSENELKLTVYANYDLDGNYVGEYYATESTGRYYFFNFYDDINGLIMTASYDKQNKELLLAYADESDGEPYMATFRFIDGKYEQKYNIYSGKPYRHEVTTGILLGIPYDFTKEDTDGSCIDTFNVLSIFGESIYKDADYLLDYFDNYI